MTTIDAEALRAGLAEEERELQEAITREEAELRQGPDAQLSAAIELRRTQLRRVRKALDRHHEGTWQRCEECGGRITDEQIRVLATATHCEDCADSQLFWGDTRVVRREDLGLGG